jgi:hypothetical protein
MITGLFYFFRIDLFTSPKNQPPFSCDGAKASLFLKKKAP